MLTCDPFNVSLAPCMAAQLTYQVQVVAYLGPASYTSDVQVAAVTDPTFVVPYLHDSTTASQVSVTWAAPANASVNVTGYRVWMTYAGAHNGFLNASSTDFPIELRAGAASARRSISAASQRLVVDSNITSVDLSGCFATSDGGQHCLQPWTYYSVYVSALSDDLDGAPAQVTVLTATATPLAPISVNATDTTDTSITLLWELEYLTGPVALFVVTLKDEAGPGIVVFKCVNALLLLSAHVTVAA